jgi:hypothetical protein
VFFNEKPPTSISNHQLIRQTISNKSEPTPLKENEITKELK